jgi:predicted dehydrogenase
MKNTIWLIGATQMSEDYSKILKDMNTEFLVIGRGKENALRYKENTGIDVIDGGLNKFLESNPKSCTHAIVSVGVESLYGTVKALINYGIKNILVEKPGSMKFNEFEDINKLIKQKKTNVIVAYNRRFFASVLKAQDIITKDGGVISFNFEFTEWSHVIEKLKTNSTVKEKWFLANSTHVVDLAFYLGGKPKELNAYTSGNLLWHPSASNFCGSGVSDKNALFNYQANWESAGRWSVEILTKENRLIFRPMEKLHTQKRGTIPQLLDESIDYSLDEKYKPGLYLQTKKFLDNDFENMCLFEEQFKMIKIYNKIANYGE